MDFLIGMLTTLSVLVLIGLIIYLFYYFYSEGYNEGYKDCLDKKRNLLK